MKKIFIILLLTLTGCSSTTKVESAPNNFVKLCEHEHAIIYLKDEDTNIIYFRKLNGFQGGISVYYNEKGQPMTYDEFNSVHNEKYHKGEQ